MRIKCRMSKFLPQIHVLMKIKKKTKLSIPLLQPQLLMNSVPKLPKSPLQGQVSKPKLKLKLSKFKSPRRHHALLKLKPQLSLLQSSPPLKLEKTSLYIEQLVISAPSCSLGLDSLFVVIPQEPPSPVAAPAFQAIPATPPAAHVVQSTPPALQAAAATRAVQVSPPSLVEGPVAVLALASPSVEDIKAKKGGKSIDTKFIAWVAPPNSGK